MNSRTNIDFASGLNVERRIQVINRADLPFGSRLRSHMDTYGWSCIAPRGDEKDIWKNIVEKGVDEGQRRTAYVHIPFCGTLCSFCNFQRRAGTSVRAAEYAKLVIRELQKYQDSGYVLQGGFEALYLGGGTPSILPAEAMADLLDTARDVLCLDESAEITVESTIHDLSDEKLQAMVQSGVNRLSLGVQTFDTSMRQQLGRLSDKDKIYQMVKNARTAGIKTISADILYRLPGQSIQKFHEDLNFAVALNFDGISLYPLIAMSGTPLEKQLKEGEIAPLPDLPVELEQCRSARQFLTQLGYRQDTCTHFVKSTDRNLYANIRLNDGDCLPIGCSAGGYLGPLVIMNAMDKNMYQMLIAGKKAGYMASLMLPAKSRLLRSVTGQLQRGFLNPDTVWHDDAIDSSTILNNKLDKHLEKGLLQKEGPLYELTDNGWSWCYNIAADYAGLAEKNAPAKNLMVFSEISNTDNDLSEKNHHSKHNHAMYGFSIKDISVLGVMCALVFVTQFVAAMLLHVTGIAMIPGVMQFLMAFVSSIIMYVALKKVPKTGALSVMSLVYSLMTMLLSGSILMGFGLVIGGVLGDMAARMLGGISKTIPLITALIIYRTSQTTFSKLYAFITEMTQIQLVWYLIVLAIAASAIGALAGGIAGIKLTGKISKAGVMA